MENFHNWQRKIRSACLTLTMVLLVGIVGQQVAPSFCFASAGSVQVSLPDFKVTLNGVSAENAYRQYPLIVYNAITYFPMTYDDCRFLGLETNWNAQTGLAISQSNISTSKHEDRSPRKNKTDYMADIAQFAVKINGTLVDNQKEQYPLLTFRNVTYFPLTWRFGVEAFGWDYRFDEQNGLVIRSSNPGVTSVRLPMARLKLTEDRYFYLVTRAGGYYYYQGEHGLLYQAPVGNIAAKKSVMSVMEDGWGRAGYAPQLVSDGGEVYYFKYFGPLPGRDIWHLKSDGRAEKSEFGEVSSWVKYGNGAIFFNGWTKDWINKKTQLTYQGSDAPEGKLIGDDVYQEPMRVKDDWLYVRFYREVPAEKRITQGLCRIDLKTGKTTKLADLDVMSYQLVGDNVFYRGLDCKLYQVEQKNDGSYDGIAVPQAGTLTSYTEPVGRNNAVYYGLDENGKTVLTYYKPGQTAISHDVLNGGAALLSLVDAGTYMIASFHDPTGAWAKLIVYDENGKAVFRSADQSENVQIVDGHTLLYVNDEGAVCTANLR